MDFAISVPGSLCVRCPNWLMLNCWVQSFNMPDQTLSILNWNVRGLNCPNRRSTIRETITATPCHLVCLQEKKLEQVDLSMASSLGGPRLKSFVQRPAIGTRGGILLLWDEDLVEVKDISTGTFFLSATITIICTDTSFKFTTSMGQLAATSKTFSSKS